MNKFQFFYYYYYKLKELQIINKKNEERKYFSRLQFTRVNFLGHTPTQIHVHEHTQMCDKPKR